MATSPSTLPDRPVSTTIYNVGDPNAEHAIRRNLGATPDTSIPVRPPLGSFCLVVPYSLVVIVARLALACACISALMWVLAPTDSLRDEQEGMLQSTLSIAPYLTHESDTDGALPDASIASATPFRSKVSASAPFSLASMRCPTVYIYDAMPLFKGDMPPAEINVERAFGQALGPPGIYNINQFSAAEIFIYRLYRSKHCPITKDPKKADLFFIPAMSGPRGVEEWKTMCTSQVKMKGERAFQALPHFNAQTASRHIFIISKAHSSPSRGNGCAWIRGEIPPFDKMQRFAYSHTYRGNRYRERSPDNSGPLWSKVPNVLGQGKAVSRPDSSEPESFLDGRVISIPYPTTVHSKRRCDAGSSRTVTPWARLSVLQQRHLITSQHPLLKARPSFVSSPRATRLSASRYTTH
jgi:hypothetical protein